MGLMGSAETSERTTPLDDDDDDDDAADGEEGAAPAPDREGEAIVTLLEVTEECTPLVLPDTNGASPSSASLLCICRHERSLSHPRLKEETPRTATWAPPHLARFEGSDFLFQDSFLAHALGQHTPLQLRDFLLVLRHCPLSLVVMVV